MQELTYLRGNKEILLRLPSSRTEIIDGVVWGEPCTLFTPAYWYTQYTMRFDGRDQSVERHRLGDTLAEEVAACLLGGYGIPAEIGTAAFVRLKQSGLINQLCADVGALENILYAPLQIGSRVVRYRFWRKKAQYLASAFLSLQSMTLPTNNAVELRDSLMTISGIGPKTASWAVRNWTNSDDVAILDVHVVRAGRLMNLYDARERVDKHYAQMDQKLVHSTGRCNTI